MLREHLEIDNWHVFGGSWGSTSHLIYAQNHPSRVLTLVLRGIFMCRKSELHWFYQDGASHVFPDAFDSYRDHIPIEEQDDLISAYYSRLTSDDVEVRRGAARSGHGGRWQQVAYSLTPNIWIKQKI